MSEHDKVLMGQVIINIFETDAIHKRSDRQVERIDRALVELTDALGFSQEDVEELREKI